MKSNNKSTLDKTKKGSEAKRFNDSICLEKEGICLKIDKIQKMLEMQKKFIELEQKGEITAESYFVPKEGSDLDGYKEEYSKLAMEVVEEAHKDKGSHA